MIDPFESTSRLLSDIAGSYRQQGNQRKDREADAVKLAENKRRYDAEQLRAATNRQEDLVRSATNRQEDLAYTAGRDKVSDENAKIERARKKAIDDMAIATFNRQEAEANRLANNREVLRDVDTTLDAGMLGAFAKERIGNVSGELDAQKEVYKSNLDNLKVESNYINDEGVYSPEGKKVYDTRFSEYSKIYDQQEAALRAADDVRKLDTATTDYMANMDKYFSRRERDIESAKEKTLGSVTREEFINFNRQKLIDEGFTGTAAEAGERLGLLADQMGLKTRAQMMTEANAAYEKKKATQTAQNKIINAYNKNIDTTKPIPGASDRFAELLEDVDMFYSTKDKDNALDMLAALGKMPGLSNIHPDVLKDAMVISAKQGLFTDNRFADATEGSQIKRVADIAKILSGTSGKERKSLNTDVIKAPTEANVLGGRFSNNLGQRRGELPTKEVLDLPKINSTLNNLAAVNQGTFKFDQSFYDRVSPTRQRSIDALASTNQEIADLQRRLPEMTDRLVQRPYYNKILENLQKERSRLQKLLNP